MSILGSKNYFNPQLCGLITSMVGNTYDVMHWTWGKQFRKINNIFFQMLMQIKIPNTHLALVRVFYWKKCHLYLKWIEKDCNQDKFLMCPTHPLECCFSSVINKKRNIIRRIFSHRDDKRPSPNARWKHGLGMHKTALWHEIQQLGPCHTVSIILWTIAQLNGVLNRTSLSHIYLRDCRPNHVKYIP